MGFRILGPIEAWAGDRQLPLGGAVQLKLVAFLLLHANRAVSSDMLVEAVWGPGRPTGAGRLHMAVSRLRESLAPLKEDSPALQTVGSGYLLSVGSGELDAELFRDRVREGRRELDAGSLERAREVLCAALELWRGPPLAEVAFEDFAQQEIGRLEELHVVAIEARVAADLELGEHELLIGELEALVADHPTRESLTAQLMVALYRSGRQADALNTYQRTRVRLLEEVGLEPGPVLTALQGEILAHSPALAYEAKSPASTVATAKRAPVGTVTMLFSGIEGSSLLRRELGAHFEELLARLDAVLRDACEPHGGRQMVASGHGSFIAFDRPRAALAAARAAQQALASGEWRDGARVHVRIGIHTGEARVLNTTYWGEDVNYAARLANAANGEQVLVSPTTAALVPEADLRDLGEHPLPDFPTPRRLWQLGLTDRGAPKTVSRLRSNLPSAPGRLVGRGAEVTTVIELLRSGTDRLVTVAGAGGVGKTRVALAVAGALCSELPDGVFFVPLGEARAPAEVPTAIAAGAGIRLAGATDPVARIADALCDRTILLLLDNFEHVLEAAPMIAALLAGAPAVRILITSQAPIRVRGERVVTLGALTLPSTETVEGLTASAAGSLLLDRTREFTPDFELTTANAQPLTQLCRAVSGLPLALELVAARLAAISPKDLVDRIRQGVDVLGTGPRDLPARQRGLRAALQWTHGLLTHGQAVVLRRMGTFAGPVSLDRVERVCGDGLEVLEALAHLVDLSLATRTGDGRFVLHPAVRAFAREKLEESGEASEFSRRHAAAFADVASLWGRRFLLDVDAVHAAATAEQADLNEALLWARAHDLDLFAQIAGGASMSLVLNARIGQWRALIEDAIERERAPGSSSAWLMLAGSLASLETPDATVAQSRIGRAITAADTSGDSYLACLMRTCSILNQTMSEPAADLRAQYTDLRKRVEKLGDRDYTRLVDGLEAWILFYEERYNEAERSFQDLIESPWRSDFAARMAHYDIADCLLAAGHYDRALSAFVNALLIAQHRAEPLNMAYQAGGIALALCALKRHADALEAVAAAESLHRAAGALGPASYRAAVRDAEVRCRAQLSTSDANAAYARGRDLPADHAAAAALKIAYRSVASANASGAVSEQRG